MVEHTRTDCRTIDGVTVGLIDGLIATCGVLMQRDLTKHAVQAALADLRDDDKIRAIIAPSLVETVDELRSERDDADRRIARALKIAKQHIEFGPVPSPAANVCRQIRAELNGERPARMTAGGFPYRQHPHDLSGSNVERQQVGDPGHCEDCCSVGHVVAHPDLGCGDVGCYRTHGEETDGV